MSCAKCFELWPWAKQRLLDFEGSWLTGGVNIFDTRAEWDLYMELCNGQEYFLEWTGSSTMSGTPIAQVKCTACNRVVFIAFR